jgi:hypothetical protein
LTRRLALALVVVLLAGCHARAPRQPTAPQPTVPVTGGHLVYQATLEDGSGSQRFRLAVALSRPGRFRLEFLGPVGGPRVIVASDGRNLQALFPPQRLFGEGAATSQEMEVVLGLPLTPDEFLGLLTGSPGDAGMESNPRPGVRVTYIAGDWGGPSEAQVEVTGASGDVSRYRVQYLDPGDGPWGRHAREMRLQQGERVLTLRLKSASPELPPAQAFQVEVPARFETVSLGELPALGRLLFDEQGVP